jgi:NTE family protein
MKIGLVLSGGGARGFAHLGVLKAFEEKKIPIHAISGSSAGALVGALFSNGIPPEEIMKIILAKGVMQSLKFSWSKMGLFSFDKVEVLLRQHIPHDRFENLKIPMHVCAMNLQYGEATYFSEGDLIKPILASCAIPGIFSPVKINGKAYIDGGVINNLPIEPLENITDIQIGVNIMPVEKRMPVNSAKDILMKCLMIAIGEKSLLKEPKFDLMINPNKIRSYSGFKTDSANEVFELGYQTALKDLEIFQKNMPLI